MGDEYKTVWQGHTTSNKKDWGTELHVGSLATVRAKILYMNAGESTSLKYYQTKNEVLFVRKGSVRVDYDSEKYHAQEITTRKLRSSTLIAGEVLYVQSMCPYRITALEESEIFEIGDSGRPGDAKKITDEE